MRATVMFGAGDVRIETIPDARISEATHAVVVETLPAFRPAAAADYGYLRRYGLV